MWSKTAASYWYKSYSTLGSLVIGAVVTKIVELYCRAMISYLWNTTQLFKYIRAMEHDYLKEVLKKKHDSTYANTKYLQCCHFQSLAGSWFPTHQLHAPFSPTVQIPIATFWSFKCVIFAAKACLSLAKNVFFLDLKKLLWGLAPFPQCKLKVEVAFKPGTSSTLCSSATNAKPIFSETLERWGTFIFLFFEYQRNFSQLRYSSVTRTRMFCSCISIFMLLLIFFHSLFLALWLLFHLPVLCLLPFPFSLNSTVSPCLYSDLPSEQAFLALFFARASEVAKWKSQHFWWYWMITALPW